MAVGSQTNIGYMKSSVAKRDISIFFIFRKSYFLMFKNLFHLLLLMHYTMTHVDTTTLNTKFHKSNFNFVATINILICFLAKYNI